MAGRVLTAESKPAAGATVALALPHQEIVWEEGKLRGEDMPLPEKPGDRWQRPRFFKADAEGRFRLPTEIEPAAVLVIHESGVRDAVRRLAKVVRSHAAAVGPYRGTNPVAGQTGRQRGGQPHGPSRRIRLPRHDRRLRRNAYRQGREVCVRPRASRTGADFAADQAIKQHGHHGSLPQRLVPARQGLRRATRRPCCWAARDARSPANSSAWITGTGQPTASIPRRHTSALAAMTPRGQPSASSRQARSARCSSAMSSPSIRTAAVHHRKDAAGPLSTLSLGSGFPGLCGRSDGASRSQSALGERPAPLELKGIAAVKKPFKAAQAPGDKPVEKAAGKTRRETSRQDRHGPRQSVGRRHRRAGRETDHASRQVRPGRSQGGDLGLQRRAIQRPRWLVQPPSAGPMAGPPASWPTAIFRSQ